jgi:hypothetical protein
MRVKAYLGGRKGILPGLAPLLFDPVVAVDIRKNDLLLSLWSNLKHSPAAEPTTASCGSGELVPWDGASSCRTAVAWVLHPPRRVALRCPQGAGHRDSFQVIARQQLGHLILAVVAAGLVALGLHWLANAR